jgi:peptide deformylase
LAAVQVGKLQRILVMDLDYERIDDIADDHISCCASEIKVKNSNPRILINPEIIEKSKETLIFKEGCLSFPGATADVTRPEMVTVKFLDENGKEKVEKMTDLLAICVQHEIDHLNGVTFVDYLSKLKREMILKKVQKSQK